MKNIPLPGTATGWRLALFLIVLSFIIYYSFLFDEINKEYYSEDFFNFYKSDEPKDIKVEAQIPKAVARFDARELLLIVLAQQETRDLKILVSSQEDLIFCTERPSIFGSCYQSSNVLKFGDFEPGEQKKQSMWVTVEPLSRLRGESITLRFSMTHSSDQSPRDISFGAGAKTELEIDNISILKSFVVGNLLLPPWSNGLIPSLALLYVYLLEHKIQPGQQFNVRAKKLLDTRAKKLSQWLKCPPIIWIVSLISASLLYFASCITLFYFLTDQWVCFATGGVAVLVFFLVLFFLENTDISQGDPLYTKSASSPALPSPNGSNPLPSEVSSTLARMSATLESISQVNQSGSGKLVQQLGNIVTILDRNKDVLSTEPVKKLEYLADVLQQQKDVLKQFHEEVQKMVRFLEKSQTGIQALDYPYSHLSLFKDDGLVALFKKELPGLSEQQFRKKLEDGRFAWCILSLFVRAHKEKEKWDDTLLIAGLPLRSWVSEPVFWEDKNANSIFEQWLDDLHNHDVASFEYAIPVVLDWMLRFKKNQVEKYLFEFLPKKCSPKTMVALMAKYLDFYQKDGQETDIQWDKVLNYFLNTNPSTELIADIGRVWYPLNGSLTLWEMVRQKEGEFSEEKWRKVYAALLGWLCFTPDELAQRVASEIYQNKDVRSLEKDAQLARFLQGFSSTNTGEISHSHISHVVKNWCQHRKKREAGFGARGGRPSHM